MLNQSRKKVILHQQLGKKAIRLEPMDKNTTSEKEGDLVQPGKKQDELVHLHGNEGDLMQLSEQESYNRYLGDKQDKLV